MKTQLFLLSLFLYLMLGCKDSGPEHSTLELSTDAFREVDGGNTILEVDITCSGKWAVRSNALWCMPDVLEGSGDYVLKLAVGANIEQKERSARLTVTSGGTTRFVDVSQNSSDISAEDYDYRIPVIFHVLYNNPEDSLQYVNKGRLAAILAKVNQLFRGTVNGVDMKLEFVLPEVDPEGKRMEEPGVERVKWGTASIDPYKFMSDEKNKYTFLLWDPNQYINVMVYNFTPQGGSSSTLGISHLPYTVRGVHQMAGLTVSNYSVLKLSQLKYAHCVSINSRFVYDENHDNIVVISDVNVTLAHELGHYLGLLHVFGEDSNGGVVNDCVDTDYCEDTPSYNKQEYDAYFEYLGLYEPENFTFRNLVRRKSCSGEIFISENVMDYSISVFDRFSADQRLRVRNVLNYSPLIPGPKAGLITRASSDEPLDLPMRMVE